MTEFWQCQKCKEKTEGSFAIVFALSKEHECNEALLQVQEDAQDVHEAQRILAEVKAGKQKMLTPAEFGAATSPSTQDAIVVSAAALKPPAYYPLKIEKYKRKTSAVKALADWFRTHETITADKLEEIGKMAPGSAGALLRASVKNGALEESGEYYNRRYFVAGNAGALQRSEIASRLQEQEDIVRKTLDGIVLTRYDDLKAYAKQRNLLISAHALVKLAQQENGLHLAEEFWRDKEYNVTTDMVDRKLKLIGMRIEADKAWEQNYKEFNVPMPIYEAYGAGISREIARMVASHQLGDKKITAKEFVSFIASVPEADALRLFYDWFVHKIPKIVEQCFGEVVNVKFSQQEGFVEWS